MSKTALPWWLILIVIIEIIPMFAGPWVAVTNPGFMGGPDADTINQAAYIYAARNIAVGLALMLALALRSAPMLFVLLFVRLVTDFMDLPTLLYFDLVRHLPRTVGIFVFMYYIPAMIAMVYLWRKMTGSGEQKEPA